MIRNKYATAQEAWEKVNEWLATSEDEVKFMGGVRSGNNVISYDHFMEINKLWVDPRFDFGHMFGYKIQKWTKLITNYIDFDFLDIAKSQVQEKEIKKSYNYTVGFKFSNKHASGHGCLLSLVFTRRLKRDNPLIIMNIRSSEVTKRLLMDFLLVQRIAEYIYGKAHSASVLLFCGHMYLTAENFLMYHNHKDLNNLLDGNENIIPKRIKALMEKFMGIDPETITYKVHRRAVRRLNLVDTPPLLARDLRLVKKKFKSRRIRKSKVNKES